MATERNIQMNYFNGTDYDILYPQVNLSNISGNLDASMVSYSNASTSSMITGTNVQDAIDDLFTSASNGKSLIASAVTGKGVSTSENDSWETIAENIALISTGNPVCLSSPFGTDSVTASYVNGNLRFNLPSKFASLTLIGFGFYTTTGGSYSRSYYGFSYNSYCYTGTFGSGQNSASSCSYTVSGRYITLNTGYDLTGRAISFIGVFK